MSYPNRHAVLAAAMNHVSQGGIIGLSFRGTAAVLHLTPDELGRFFEDRSALEAALVDESRRLFLAFLQTAAGTKSPEAAIQAISEAFLLFAKNEPHIFSIGQKYGGLYPENRSENTELWSFMLAKMGEIYNQHQAPTAAVALWAFLTGLAVLASTGSVNEYELIRCRDLGVQALIMAATTK